MKKIVLILISIILGVMCFSFVGCNNSNEWSNTGAPLTGNVDVDISALSSTVAYAEISNINENPSEYLDKKIRVKGLYNATRFSATDSYVHTVELFDSTNCCSAALRFVWNGQHTYPTDYPQVGTEIKVTGTFCSAIESNMTIYYLSVNNITFV